MFALCITPYTKIYSKCYIIYHFEFLFIKFVCFIFKKSNEDKMKIKSLFYLFIFLN